MHLCTRYQIKTLSLTLSLVLMEVQCLEVHVSRIVSLLLTIDLMLLLDELHLVLEEVLRLLILAELCQSLPLSLNFMLSRLLVHNLTPKLVLLILHTQITQ